ncbi:hypothetical protein NLJ89_g4225 [Agrocybe chaxingu]|uniref:Rab-GAP TBC domain-containing protein n=1 Tax=Agrocybe chaxingu TaxID=84603 RepID=A0A9W8K2I4_9AGAR|nr:hypothetical protein NLJ89_g4225 [Agrocybe chaxingu]
MAAAAAHSLNKLLSQPKAASKSRATGEIDDGTKKLRRMILVEGIPSSIDPTLRPRIWKILLRVNELPTDTYLHYVSRGPCQVREKIRNDTFRTLATDKGFKERVREDMLLLDRCLQFVDPELYGYLRSKNLSAEIYAFPSILTLCACTPPLDQVLQLWDFLLAFGVHLNVLCVIAQLLLMRDEVMASSSPMRLLRTFPPLEALPVIGIAVTLVRDLPPELYDELVKHPFEVVH